MDLHNVMKCWHGGAVVGTVDRQQYGFGFGLRPKFTYSNTRFSLANSQKPKKC